MHMVYCKGCDHPQQPERQGSEFCSACDTAPLRMKHHSVAMAHALGRNRFALYQHLARQRKWSEETFGPGPRVEMVIDHITKELKEIKANPKDISEWIDVVILALDGAWRAGYSPEEIVAALAAKQAKNEARKWPDWRTAEPGKAIEHDRG